LRFVLLKYIVITIFTDLSENATGKIYTVLDKRVLVTRADVKVLT